MTQPTTTPDFDARVERAPSTLGEWLDALSPPPPPALVERLHSVLAPYANEPVASVPDVCLRAGESLLESLLASGSTSRGSALDLLTVDALVTYAFEAASSAPADFESRAAAAMRRIAALPQGSPD